MNLQAGYLYWQGFGRGLPGDDPHASYALQFAPRSIYSKSLGLPITHRVCLSKTAYGATTMIFAASYSFEVPLCCSHDVCAIVASMMIGELQYHTPLRYVISTSQPVKAEEVARYWDGVIQSAGDSILRIALAKTPYTVEFYKRSAQNQAVVMAKFPPLSEPISRLSAVL
jgi:hypothetical protein